jgi:hypothetical protein
VVVLDDLVIVVVVVVFLRTRRGESCGGSLPE